MDETFDRFVKNAKNINETWQIVEFFEEEYKKFKDEVATYEQEKLKEQELLKSLRTEYLELQSAIKSARDELAKSEEEKCDNEADSIDNLRQNIPVRPLEKVDIRLKDGVVVKANPAGDVYAKEIVEKYVTCLRELKAIKTKLLNSDLENAKLRNEIRDLKAERKMI